MGYTKLIGNTSRYPYLVGVSALKLGTGLLIDSRFVLTCFHVIDKSSRIEVISHAGSETATVKRDDPNIDLALLELKNPIQTSNPRFTDSPLKGGSFLVAVGVHSSPNDPDSLSIAEVDLKYKNMSVAGGEILDIQFDGGARPAYSGGPVVLRHGEIPLCVGITRLGGDRASSSNAIGIAQLLAFLGHDLRQSCPLETKPSLAIVKDSELHQLEVAAIRGDPEAQFRLAQIYADPSDSRYAPEKAIRWFRAAADQEHAASAQRLALACRRGEGVLRSEPEALRWFHIAAKLGNPDAQAMFGQMLLDGRAGSKDAVAALKMFKLSAKQGNSEAAYQLALLLFQGASGVPQDEVGALDGFRQAAECGLPAAQFYLAWMLANGRGTPAEPAEALQWAEQAASSGHYGAQELVRDLSEM
jgi:TPR repeat protein